MTHKKVTREDRLSQLTGLLMAIVWLGFLGFPIAEILTSNQSLAWKAFHLGLLICFIVAYTWGMIYSLTRPAPFSDKLYPTSVAIIIGVGTIFAVFTYLNPGGVPLGIYLVALIVITLPPRIGYPLGGVLTLFLIWAMAFVDSGGMLVTAIVAIAVYISTLGSSFFTRQSERDTLNARREAIIDERDRVARDVHDVLGHTLTVISLKSELAAKLLDKDADRARAEILEINALSRRAISEVRSTVSGLSTRQFSTELAAVRKLASDIGLRLTINGDEASVDPGNRILFGWVVREAITNVVRHANATAVTIDIDDNTLSIADDGVGFDPSRSGNGLRGLRQRVADAGAALSLSSDSTGTRIEVTL